MKANAEDHGVLEHANATGVLSFAELFEIVVRRRRIWTVTLMVTAVLAVAVALILPPQFRSTASFVPEITGPGAAEPTSFLSEQASAFGFDFGNAASADAAFYVELLRSREIREAIVHKEFHSTKTTFRGDLVEFFEHSDVTPPEKATERALKDLLAKTRVARDGVSGLVTLSTTTSDASISQQIATAYLVELERFNKEQRTTRTRTRLEFLARQLEAAEDNLRTVEDSALAFLEENRLFQDSPDLVFRKARLDRQITLNVGIVSRLQQQLEQAQLDLLRKTPTISVVDSPNTPEARVSPRRKLIVLSAATLGFLGGLLLTLAVEGYARIYAALSPGTRSIVDRLTRWIPGRGHSDSSPPPPAVV